MNLLLSKSARSAAIPLAMLWAIASGCADDRLTGPVNLAARHGAFVPFSSKFLAWSEYPNSSAIGMQLFSVNLRQERQFAYWAEDARAFARANPGRLYINGDEPDQYCVTPADYAVRYRNFVEGVRSADPTARFSPAGFAEPNDKCCPPPDDVPASCWYANHSIGYAQQFYDAYVALYKVPPPVDEWRFHDFGLRYKTGDIAGWWSRVDLMTKWSIEHGANMVLGSWGFLGWREPDSSYVEHLKQAMNLIMNDSRINASVYWSYQQWLGNPHYLANGDGSLTKVGQAYVNPLTDVPSGPTLAVDTAGAKARLAWSNTTAAWSAEAEFWTQAPGSTAYTYKATERTEAAATQTSLIAFTPGDSLKARVRYYNAYGQAAWTPFSNAVLIQSSEASKKGGSWTGTVFCFLSKRIQSQPCS